MSQWDVIGTGTVNGLGIGSQSVISAIAAGISVYRDSQFTGFKGRRIKMALVPNECLPDINQIQFFGRTQRYLRMLKLALLACEEAFQMANISTPVPAFIASPERRPGLNYVALEPFIRDLNTCLMQSGKGSLDLKHSVILPEGHAGGFNALKLAQDYLQEGGELALVGGVDTYNECRLLQDLALEGRLLLEQCTEGFVPGEGASFFIVRSNCDEGYDIKPKLSKVGIGFEPGHFYSEETCLAEGMTNALAIALREIENPAKTVFCSLNGESKQIKEWGMSSIRNADALSDDLFMVHPADGYGDLGAATAPTLISMACHGLDEGYYVGPILTWAWSDFGLRGSVVVS